MTTVGLFFGGRSVEHEVSVVTAMQVLAAMPDTLRTVPVYIAKSGRWYTGDGLRRLDGYRDIERLIAGSVQVTMRPEPDGGRLTEVAGKRGILGGGAARELASIDVAMPLVHGSGGEDGTLQGLFELCDIAYTGCGVAAAAVSMDKRATKAMFRSAQLPVLDDVLVTRPAWHADRAAVTRDVEQRLGYPVFVKPLSLGSSIGVNRAADAEQLAAALDTALTYDVRCIIERAQESIIEINCSVLGRGDDLRVSVCEQPRATGLLSYEDKYLTKGAKDAPTGMKGAHRLIPAPIPDTLTKRLQDAAATAFHAIGAEGVARVDFLVSEDSGEFIVNEINTTPGSLSFYLWEPAGVGFTELISTLVAMATRRQDERRATTTSIDSWLLRGRPRP